MAFSILAARVAGYTLDAGLQTCPGTADDHAKAILALLPDLSGAVVSEAFGAPGYGPPNAIETIQWSCTAPQTVHAASVKLPDGKAAPRRIGPAGELYLSSQDAGITTLFRLNLDGGAPETVNCPLLSAGPAILEDIRGSP